MPDEQYPHLSQERRAAPYARPPHTPQPPPHAAYQLPHAAYQPPQGPYPQPPGYPPPPYQWTPPRAPKRRTGLWVAITVLILLFGGCAVVVASIDRSMTAGEEEKRGPAGRIGDSVRDGRFTFTVTRIERAAVLPRDEYRENVARGEWLVFDATVRNHSELVAWPFEHQDQRLYFGKAYYKAEIPESAIFDTGELEPGETFRTRLVFDVPKGSRPSYLELHDSSISDGVGIALPE